MIEDDDANFEGMDTNIKHSEQYRQLMQRNRDGPTIAQNNKNLEFLNNPKYRGTKKIKPNEEL